ncbi:hypothetical protein LXL04_032964 [Taraxacum kok-saghyz]
MGKKNLHKALAISKDQYDFKLDYYRNQLGPRVDYMGVRMAEVVTLTHFAFSNSNHLLHHRLPHHHHIHRRSPPPSPYGLHVTVHERRTSAPPSNFVTVICQYCHPLIESVDDYLLRFHLLFPPPNLMSDLEVSRNKKQFHLLCAFYIDGALTRKSIVVIVRAWIGIDAVQDAQFLASRSN